MSKTLPACFEAGLIFVRPTASNGTALRLFTDSGGAAYLRESVVKRLSLPVSVVQMGDDELRVVSMPDFLEGASIPPILADHDPRDAQLRGKLLVAPDNFAPYQQADGMLGAPWFGGRVWVIDYPGQRLSICTDAPPTLGDQVAPLGFPVDESGRRAGQFPSIDATIDGETHGFLLDTGATLHLTGHARAALGGSAQARGTCFVARTLFDRWRTSHPTWRVLEDADAVVRGEPAIEVPTVSIADLEVGPVLFTSRPDRNFNEYMSGMMDRRVEGAIGASLLSYFVVTIDYLSAVASFEMT